MTTITSALLNELENKFTQHGLGYEYIPDAELTYQKCVDTIENGYMPLLDGGNMKRYMIIDNIYYITLYNSDAEYSASSPTEIMTLNGNQKW